MPYAITDKGWRSIGDGWDLAENETYVDELPEWLLTVAEQQRNEATTIITLNSLMDEAGKVIQPLQDDYDINDISDENLFKLKAWKRYRSALSKTPEREGWPATPDWPAQPEV